MLRRSLMFLFLVWASIWSTTSSAEELVVRRGEITAKVSCLTDPTQTYALYLPPNWNPETKHPVLLVFDPRQRGEFAAEIFRPAAEELGWVIVSSNDTRSDGPEEPNIKALNALWPEVHQRHAIDPNRIYAAGFSGGGILTLLLATATGEVAGVIDCGGRLPPEMSLEGATFAHYGTAGRYDFNYMEMHQIDMLMAQEEQPHRLDIFEGRHQWMSADLATTAMRWLELVAMQQRRREVDRPLVSIAYQEDLDRAVALESTRIVEAYRHYEMMARTYDGLTDTGAVDKALERIGGSKALAAARREQKKANDLESRFLGSMRKAILAIQASDNPLSRARFRAELRLDELQRSVRKGGAQGEAAQRVLESIFSHTSFYLPNQFFASGDLPKAATVLEVAADLHPETPFVHYNLACAYSRLGEKGKALDEIESAIHHGFRNLELLMQDPDLERIRSEPRFQKVIERLR